VVEQCCSGSTKGTGTATKWAKWVKRFRPSVTGVVLAAAPTAVMTTLMNFWGEGTELVVGSMSEQVGKSWSPCWWMTKLVGTEAWWEVRPTWPKQGGGWGGRPVLFGVQRGHRDGQQMGKVGQEVPTLRDWGGVGGGHRCSHDDPCELLGEGTGDGSPPRLVVGSVSEQGGKSWSPRWWVAKLVAAEAWWLVGTGILGVQRVGRVMVATVSPKRVKRFHVSLTGVVLAAAPTAVMMTLVNFWEEGTEDGSPPRLVVGSVSEQVGKRWLPCWWVTKLVEAWWEVRPTWPKQGGGLVGRPVLFGVQRGHRDGHQMGKVGQEVPTLRDRGGVGGGPHGSHDDPCELLGGRDGVGGGINERASWQELVTTLVGDEVGGDGGLVGSQTHWGQTGLVDQCCSGSTKGTGTASKWAKWVKRSRPSVTGVVLVAATAAVMVTLVNFCGKGRGKEDGSPPRWVD
jgi:hypothetical protein